MMEISYATSKLQKLCNSDKKARGEWGPIGAAKLQSRLTELDVAERLEDLRYLPQARCHELKGDRKGQLAVDLEHPKRLIFEPDHEPTPCTEDGSLDWSRITRVRILAVVDYH